MKMTIKLQKRTFTGYQTCLQGQQGRATISSAGMPPPGTSVGDAGGISILLHCPHLLAVVRLRRQALANFEAGLVRFVSLATLEKKLVRHSRDQAAKGDARKYDYLGRCACISIRIGETNHSPQRCLQNALWPSIRSRLCSCNEWEEKSVKSRRRFRRLEKKTGGG